MQNPDEMLPLVTYGWLIWALGIVCILIALAWPIWMWISHEKKKRKVDLTPIKAPSAHKLQKLRREHRDKIKRAYQDYQKQEISYAQLYQRLSQILREFVAKATGAKTQVMVLEELEHEHQELARVIALYYPSEFSGLENIQDTQAATSHAIKLVDEWN